MKVTEVSAGFRKKQVASRSSMQAVFQRMDARIATELAGLEYPRME